MIRITKIIPKDEVFGLLENPEISSIEMNSQKNRSIKNPKMVRVSMYISVPFSEFVNVMKTVDLIGYNHTFLKKSNQNFVYTLRMAFKMGYIRAKHILKLKEIENQENIHFQIPNRFLKLIEKYDGKI
jgi:hypothetical protein